MKKILIIEDHDGNALLMKEIIRQSCKELGLSDEDFTIERTKEEKEAIQLIGTNDYCLNILDGHLLNDGLGINVLYAIDTKIFPKIIVASTDEDFVKYCLEKNIHALSKQNFFDAKDLIKQIIKASM